MRWTGYVAHVCERKTVYLFWRIKLRERVHLEDLGLDERLILKWILRNKIGLLD
jgi:hypothetical protein